MEKHATPKEDTATEVRSRAITGEAGYGSPVDDAALPGGADNTLNLVDDDEKAGARGDVATE